jgi:hypothetical protein
MASNGIGLVELDIGDIELLDEEAGPSKNAFENQNIFLKNKKDVNDLMHMSQMQILMLTTFDM